MSSVANAWGSGSLERSLQWGLGWLALVVLLSLTGVGVWVGQQTVEQFVAARLAHDAEALIAGLGPSAERIDRPLPPVYSQPFSGHYFLVRLPDDRLIRSRSLWDHPLVLAALPPGETALERREGPQGERLLVWIAGYEKRGQGFTVAIAEDISPLRRGLQSVLWVGAGIALIGVFTLLVVQRWLLRRGFRQIDAVRSDIGRLEVGEIDRLGEEVPAEVGPLVRELNQLIDGWRAHLERSRNALGNLAHALKSPLNLILLHQAEVRDDLVAAQAERMRELIEHQLRRARLVGDRTPGRRFHPREDIGDLVAGIRTLYADKALDILTDIETPERLAFDQEDMLELSGNLLDNAAKWAHRQVHLSLKGDAKRLRIRVEDDGPGVDAQAAEVLARRGGRLDETKPGQGLGLAIVGDIVRLQGGELVFERSASLGGLAVTLELPIPKGEG